ncbi:hypothetical protein ELS19_17000 [Halogeometricum borinquense]|uniref:Uncharacterized protein n=1 Tax=Halogeometricum borinquense TaxID=60847 RepID=A0A482T740_9EURY|nr:hypothetical protein ELS19_17000 [Halogeometricum borinquense]
MVGAACELSGGYLSYATCFEAAVASAEFSPLGSAAIGALCTYLIEEASILSCGSGAYVICSSTGICQPIT